MVHIPRFGFQSWQFLRLDREFGRRRLYIITFAQKQTHDQLLFEGLGLRQTPGRNTMHVLRRARAHTGRIIVAFQLRCLFARAFQLI